MKYEELRLFGLRHADVQDRYKSTLIVLIVAILISLVIFGYIGLVAQAQVRERTGKMLLGAKAGSLDRPRTMATGQAREKGGVGFSIGLRRPASLGCVG